MLTALIHQQLLRAQQRMKAQADKGRSEREFTKGDMVYLKVQPYIQSSVAARQNQKLSFRFFGPYHVSQLKKFVAPGVQVSSDIPDLPSESDDSPLPVAVIASKAVARGSSVTTKLLI